MEVFSFHVFLIIIQLTALVTSSELLHNHDFEITHFTGNWVCNTCTISTSKVHISGYHSALITARQHKYSGAQQTVNLLAGHRYKFTGFINLQGTGSNSVTVELMASCTSNGHKHYVKFGHVPYVQHGEWTKVGGVNTLPAGAHGCQVYVQVLDQHVNYYIDQFSLEEIPDDVNWRSEANTRIDKLRKADVTIRLSDNGVGAANMAIEFVQRRHAFAFGTAVNAAKMVDPTLTQYQNFVYDNFEWAVLENALKWKQMEWQEGHINYDKPLNAIKVLKEHGMKVRGHNVFWASESHNPSWVLPMHGQTLLDAMATRINGVIGHTKGVLEHWDVNNENLHGNFFEQHTGDPNITMKMFRDVHAVDSNVKLFLNDFNIMRSGLATMGLRNQALLLKTAKVPIYGVGIQSHLHDASIDIPAMKAKLDLVAEAGLPIWITELSLTETDEHIKAQAITDILTLYFSHPSVEGVLLWGFWDGQLFNNAAKLAEGPNVTPNAAGRAYQTLFKTTWRTNETHPVTSNIPLTVRCFQGDYTVNIKHNDQIIKSVNFTLDTNGKDLTIHLTGTGSSPGVSNVLVGK